MKISESSATRSFSEYKEHELLSIAHDARQEIYRTFDDAFAGFDEYAKGRGSISNKRILFPNDKSILVSPSDIRDNTIRWLLKNREELSDVDDAVQNYQIMFSQRGIDVDKEGDIEYPIDSIDLGGNNSIELDTPISEPDNDYLSSSVTCYFVLTPTGISQKVIHTGIPSDSERVKSSYELLYELGIKKGAVFDKSSDYVESSKFVIDVEDRFAIDEDEVYVTNDPVRARYAKRGIFKEDGGHEMTGYLFGYPMQDLLWFAEQGTGHKNVVESRRNLAEYVFSEGNELTEFELYSYLVVPYVVAGDDIDCALDIATYWIESALSEALERPNTEEYITALDSYNFAAYPIKSEFTVSDRLEEIKQEGPELDRI